LILTVTLNPAVDRNVTADRLVFEDRAYILARSESAGGRGINASCVISSFGGRTLAIAPSGGETGAQFKRFLRDFGFPVDLVPIKNEIRTNFTITDKHGLTIKLNEVGPSLSKKELAAVEEAVLKRLPHAKWLMICGSVPPGVPPGFYVKLIELAHQHKVKVLLDTDGPALFEGIEAGPAVVTPNQQEAERLLNTALLTRGQFLEAASRIRSMGAEAVVISLGSRGAVGAWENKLIEVVPPRVDAVCPIGAGDALAASFVWAMHKKPDFADAVRWGVAAGTASTRLPGLRFASLAQTQEIYDKVEIRTAK
jgi:1-phosphofructokinase family hexose kinase